MEKINELRKNDKTKLTELLGKKSSELIDKKIMYTIGKSKDASIFNKLKKDIARIKTILKEKEVLTSAQGENGSTSKGSQS